MNEIQIKTAQQIGMLVLANIEFSIQLEHATKTISELSAKVKELEAFQKIPEPAELQE